ncbi:MAG: hypothetical protein JW722_08755 [Demequinaceae bacterium]|nr:hypothetical protein [Demequinaceae bacterium]
MTEWWQQGDDDKPVPVPRRDQVPEAHFSDLTPESTSFGPVSLIPEWRARRRVIALAVTVSGLGVIVWLAIEIVQLMSVSCPTARAAGMPYAIIETACLLIAAVVVVKTWQWANERDPMDFRVDGP